MSYRSITHNSLLFGLLGTLLTGCGGSPKDVLAKFLKTHISDKNKHALICEKKYVSYEDMNRYYWTPEHQHRNNAAISAIREASRNGNKISFEVDTFDNNAEAYTTIFIVLRRPNEGYCVKWLEPYGRHTQGANRLIRYPLDKITLWTSVELSDYYNYDFRDREDTHMSLKIRTDNSYWDFKNVYIPYAGNEDIYDIVSSQKRTGLKMIVSRGYELNIDPRKVQAYKDALVHLDDTSIAQDASGSYKSTFQNYRQPFTTKDEDILFARTAVHLNID